ncbi:trypco2 family protein [Micromonospora sp.]|uniref:trypco2 family protein n=1 Tax=Micromonospora sp. TaxID=1876 RepID=UPI003B3BDD1C
MASDPVVGLGEAIQALREQLALARRDGWFHELGFHVAPVELTIQAVVEKGADGKIGWGVLSVGGDYKSSTTQTLKLTLTPGLRRPDGTLDTDFEIGNQQTVEPRFGGQVPGAQPDPAAGA